MKQLLPFLLAFSICFVGCKDDDDDNQTTDPNLKTLELVYSDSVYQFTGVAKDPTGDKMFVNYPRWGGPYQYGVVQTTGTNSAIPFPDAETNMWINGEDGENKWVCAQSVYFDSDGNLWVLDPASPNIRGVQQKSFKLVKINKTTGAWEKKFEFDSVATDNSYINDVRVDVGRQFAYLTNSSEGGIVVINIATGQMRQVLTGHYSVHSDPNFRFIIDGKELTKAGVPVKFNSDGIALTPDGDYLYYKPTTDDKLYRIKTEYLRDFSLKYDQLASHVEDLGHKCTSDGMIFDNSGNLYLGDIINYRIVRIDPGNNHSMTTIVDDKKLIWPDSYSVAGGYLYITVSQIQKQPDYNEGANKRTSPYTIYRIPL